MPNPALGFDIAFGSIGRGILVRMRTLELNHVAVFVTDVSRSRQFYREVLQLEEIPRPAFTFPGAWFRLGLVQELHIIGERPDQGVIRERGDHFALKVDDLEAWREHLQSLGAILRGPVRRPDGAMQIFIGDPDGHLIELFCPPSPTQ